MRTTRSCGRSVVAAWLPQYILMTKHHTKYNYLANHYSCSDEKDGIDSMKTVVQQGRFIALDSSKLGHPALQQLESVLYDGSKRVIPVYGRNKNPQAEVGDEDSQDKVFVIIEEG